jgi:hypothetical protein
LLSNLSEIMKGFFLEPRRHSSMLWCKNHRRTSLRRRRTRLLPGTLEPL